ncbi:MAG: EF-Tu/IF-2/RF-3 family GTPase [candidate division WOR-3 bacterium]
MEELIGKITHYFGKISVGIIEVTAGELKVGDTIHIKGKNSDFTQKVESMQLEHKPIDKAVAGQAIGLKVTNPVHENDQVFKVTE